ncbi:hypothetical protein V5S96_04060 [Corynebacterium mastitidis]|uniref:Uncharacterized protein n=1 Tax=Corynebacterium mastitidis TaxID=161890 RepID=A0ABU8NZI1_9CORY
MSIKGWANLAGAVLAIALVMEILSALILRGEAPLLRGLSLASAGVTLVGVALFFRRSAPRVLTGFALGAGLVLWWARLAAGLSAENADGEDLVFTVALAAVGSGLVALLWAGLRSTAPEPRGEAPHPGMGKAGEAGKVV